MSSKARQEEMSASLLTKNVYGICFTERESLDCVKDPFFSLRRQFFEGFGKTVKISEKKIYNGLAGKIKGRMSAHSLLWRKALNTVVVEQTYQVPEGTVLVRRNFENLIIAKVYFDRDHHWSKSEYYEAPDATAAKIVLRPAVAENVIERFDYDANAGGYVPSMLYPAPYRNETASQRSINAKLGRPPFILLGEDGMFSYTAKEDAEQRVALINSDEEKESREILAWREESGRKRGEREFSILFTDLSKRGKVKNTTQSLPQPSEKQADKAVQPAEKVNDITSAVKTAEDKAEKAPAVHSDTIKTTDVENKEDTPAKNIESVSELEEKNQIEDTITQTEETTDAFEICEQILSSTQTTPVTLPDEPEESLRDEESVWDEQSEQILDEAKAAVKNRMAKEKGEDEKAELLEPVALKQELYRNSVLRQVLPAELERHFTASKFHSKIEPKASATAVDTESNDKTEELTEIELQLAQFIEKVEESLHQPDKAAQNVKNIIPKKKTADTRETIYRASVVDGKIAGISGIKRSGVTSLYEGETVNGKRSGFGVSYSENGSLVYAGFWKDDRKNGLGISFRESDHAVHVASWQDDIPDSFVSLFDTKGNLQYTGNVQEGKKDGIGISYRLEDGSIFVGKWDKGQPTGFGSVFDAQGHIIYTGMWSDGKRNGTGSEFDSSGEVIFTGEWREDKHYNGVLYKRPTTREA